MAADSSDRAIVENVIYMARRFCRDLLAEGVESLDHATALLELGCELAQAFAFLVQSIYFCHEFARSSARTQSLDF